MGRDLMVGGAYVLLATKLNFGVLIPLLLQNREGFAMADVIHL